MVTRVPTRAVTAAVILLLLNGVAHASTQVPKVKPIVHKVYPHDPQAFTQGLLFWEGRLFESTGLRGQSTLRRVDLSTGIVEQSVPLAPNEFGEGLARVGDKLVQLTWTAGRAHVYSLKDLQRLETHQFTGQGWGLCFDGRRLVMTDGSSSLFFRDPLTFELKESRRVHRGGQPVTRLNELECTDEFVYANVWQTEEIVKIDATSGDVVATISAGGLLTPSEARVADVLNGIAYAPATGRFFLTGKLWPKLFEVSFPAAAAPAFRGPPATRPDPPSNGPVPPSMMAVSGAPSAAAVPTAPPVPQVSPSCRCGVGKAGSRRLPGVELLLALLWLRRNRRSVDGLR